MAETQGTETEINQETLIEYAIFLAALKVAQQHLAKCKPQFVEYYCKKYDAMRVKNLEQVLAKTKERGKYKTEVEKDFTKFNSIIDGLTNSIAKSDSENTLIKKIADNFQEFAEYLKDNITIVK